MHRQLRTLLPLLAVALLATGACSTFEDPTPHTLYFKLDGDAGRQVQLVYSTEFVAGVDETGVTQVQVFRSDTVSATLPVDTLFDISLDRRWFVEATPMDTTSTTIHARVDVDDRNLFDKGGDVVQSDPWHFVYLYNQQVTQIVNVVF